MTPPITPNHLQPDPVERVEFDGLVQMHDNLDRRLEAHERMLGRDGAELHRIIREAFEEAIDAKATDPAMWAKVRQAMIRQTAEGVGNWLIDGIKSGVKAAAWIALGVLVLYQIGGLKLVAATLAGLNPKT